MRKILLVTFVLFAFIQLQAQPGELDSTFGINGIKTVIPYPSRLLDAIQLPDGRMILLSYSQLMCLSPNGDLDLTFGVNGFVNFTYAYFGQAIACQTDGKILVTGSTNISGYIEVARYNTNGTPDNSFGLQGKSILPLGGIDANYAITFQTNGLIDVAGGYKKDEPGQPHPFIMQYKSNGELDSSFAQNGKAELTTIKGEFSCVAAGRDGKIIAGGYEINNGFLVMRYTSTGEPDLTFDNDGKVNIIFDNPAAKINSIVILNNEKIIAAGGDGYENTLSSCALVKLNKDGTPDEGFADRGKLIINDMGGFSKVVLQKNKKVLLSKSYYNTTQGNQNQDFEVIRLLPDGTYDNTFGTNGIITTDIEGNDQIVSIFIQNTGKIVATGFTYSRDVYHLARYLGDSIIVLAEPLLHFTATPAYNGNIVLNWQTATATNLSYYNLQRSADSRFSAGSISALTRITAVNGTQSYSFTDNAPSQGTNYYRLQQVDNDGESVYSNIVSATIESGLAVTLFPNPVKDVLHIKGLNTTMSYVLSVTDEKGNIVAKTAVNNNTSYSWNVQRLNKGLYYLKIISNNNKTAIAKFIKE